MSTRTKTSRVNERPMSKNSLIFTSKKKSSSNTIRIHQSKLSYPKLQMRSNNFRKGRKRSLTSRNNLRKSPCQKLLSKSRMKNFKVSKENGQ